MKLADVRKLHRLAIDAGLNGHAIIVAMHIAAEHAADPGVQIEYGYLACLELVELQADLEKQNPT